jgi:hypothetical protein
MWSDVEEMKQFICLVTQKRRKRKKKKKRERERERERETRKDIQSVGTCILQFEGPKAERLVVSWRVGGYSRSIHGYSREFKLDNGGRWPLHDGKISITLLLWNTLFLFLLKYLLCHFLTLNMILTDFSVGIVPG